MSTRATLLRGDPAPWFTQRSFSNPRYHIDVAGGRYLVLCFLGSATEPHAQAALAAVAARADRFDDKFASFFGITADTEDDTRRRVADRFPGYRFLFDLDFAVSRLYGVVDSDAAPGGPISMRRCWVVTDPTLRVLGVVRFAPDQSDIAEVMALLDGLPPPASYAGVELQAPVLLLPNVFEPEFCAELIARYEASDPQESGFMREVDGKTVTVNDHRHKRRRDHTLEDEALIKGAHARFGRRVVPEIAKVHQFLVTRMERYLVACYDAEEGGHFNAHRDNTTKGTAHRRFAVSVNLNEDFDDGEVSFPEYGPRSFKAPTGGAVVFSCSLLHAVSTVTRGRRYAFLPFLYDEAAAKVREANAAFLEDAKQGYRATPE